MMLIHFVLATPILGPYFWYWPFPFVPDPPNEHNASGTVDLLWFLLSPSLPRMEENWSSNTTLQRHPRQYPRHSPPFSSVVLIFPSGSHISSGYFQSVSDFILSFPFFISNYDPWYRGLLHGFPIFPISFPGPLTPDPASPQGVLVPLRQLPTLFTTVHSPLSTKCFKLSKNGLT